MQAPIHPDRGPRAGERLLVLGIYVLSGACGLVYEVVWTRHLSLTFGVTVFATSAVVAAFMAGLGLGSSLVARWIDHSPNPVRVYALLEQAHAHLSAVPELYRRLQEPVASLLDATTRDGGD